MYQQFERVLILPIGGVDGTCVSWSTMRTVSHPPVTVVVICNEMSWGSNMAEVERM